LVRSQLNQEVAVAIRGLQVDIDQCADRERALVSKWEAARERMSRLAGARAEYANLVSTVQNHMRLVEAARKNLADARARQAAAHSSSVITRIDGVEAGVRPIGPGRKTVAAAGGIGGLLLGFGFVFLFATPAAAAAATAPTGTARNTAAFGAQPVAVVSAGNDPAEPAASYVSDNGSVAQRMRSTTESFGMFRGMTLQDAVRAVELRGN
jgi:hypothetical protein